MKLRYKCFQVLWGFRSDSRKGSQDVIESIKVKLFSNFACLFEIWANEVSPEKLNHFFVLVTQLAETTKNVCDFGLCPFFHENAFLVLGYDLICHLVEQVLIVHVGSCPPKRNCAAWKQIKSVSHHHEVTSRELLNNLSNVWCVFLIQETRQHKN